MKMKQLEDLQNYLDDKIKIIETSLKNYEYKATVSTRVIDEKILKTLKEIKEIIR